MAVSDARERDVVNALLRLADQLVDDFDFLELTIQLTEDCVRILDVAAAGLLLADAGGVLHLLATTSAQANTLELFQLQRDEGPCLDCFRTGRPVTVPDLAAQSDRWPNFTATALDEGFHSVHAIPMRLREEGLGALGLFGTSPGALGEDELHLARALAHVASLAIGQQGHAISQTTALPALQAAVASRAVLEMARGVVSETLSIDIELALTRIRNYAFGAGRQLSELAQLMVAGDSLERRAVLESMRLGEASEERSRPNG